MDLVVPTESGLMAELPFQKHTHCNREIERRQIEIATRVFVLSQLINQSFSGGPVAFVRDMELTIMTITRIPDIVNREFVHITRYY